MIAVIVIA